MYNRYIPQPDGTYRRSQRNDTPSRPPTQQAQQQPPQPCPPQSPPQDPVCQQEQTRHQGIGQHPHGHTQRRRCPPPPPPPPMPEPCRDCRSASVGGFLKNLLPKDFDTGDLLIVLLLLLMAGDCPEEQNTALLTLVLYLFL